MVRGPHTDRINVQNQILAALCGGPKTMAELMAAVTLPEGRERKYAENTLTMLKAKGEVAYSLATKHYTLGTDAPVPPPAARHRSAGTVAAGTAPPRDRSSDAPSRLAPAAQKQAAAKIAAMRNGSSDRTTGTPVEQAGVKSDVGADSTEPAVSPAEAVRDDAPTLSPGADREPKMATEAAAPSSGPDRDEVNGEAVGEAEIELDVPRFLSTTDRRVVSRHQQREMRARLLIRASELLVEAAALMGE